MTKSKFAAHEAEDDEQLQQWHDEAYAEYEKALEAYTKSVKQHGTKPSGLIDNKAKRDYEEARDALQAGVIYWRQIGEQVGTRVGVQVVDNTDEGAGE